MNKQETKLHCAKLRDIEESERKQTNKQIEKRMIESEIREYQMNVVVHFMYYSIVTFVKWGIKAKYRTGFVKRVKWNTHKRDIDNIFAYNVSKSIWEIASNWSGRSFIQHFHSFSFTDKPTHGKKTDWRSF